MESNTMEKARYSLYAMQYCMWIWNLKKWELLWSGVSAIPYHFTKYVLRRYHRKFLRYYSMRTQQMSPYVTDIEDGKEINQAERLVESICFWYTLNVSIYFTLIIAAVIPLPYILFLGVSMIPFMIENWIFKTIKGPEKTYLEYFQDFELMDDEWYRGWKKRTLLFMFGLPVSVGISIGCMLLLWNNGILAPLIYGE